MFNLNDVPPPPNSHYVGIIYSYEENGVPEILTVRNRDTEKDHVSLKLPGGGNERIHEEYILFENALFKTLELLKFSKTAMGKAYRNESKRKKLIDEQGADKSLAFILRTMVIKSLEDFGYYPMDLEPKVVHFVEKDYHTQYFIEVTHFIDANGNDVEIPDITDEFKSLDSDVIETRLPLQLVDYKKLIHSHRSAIEKYILFKGKKPST